MRSDVGESSVSRSLVRLCAQALIHRGPTRQRATTNQPNRLTALFDSYWQVGMSTCNICSISNVGRALHLIRRLPRHRMSTNKKKKKGVQLEAHPAGQQAGPDVAASSAIYLMLGLPAFDQSAVGSELSSGPSPNTFPTLLGLGIALTFPSSSPAAQKESVADLQASLLPTPTELSGCQGPYTTLLLCLGQAGVNHHVL